MNNNDKNLWTYHQIDNSKHLTQGHPRQEMLFRKITRLVKSGKVLEIGFGDGYLLNKLSKRYESYGADISVENIKKISKTNSEVNFKLIDVDGKLPFKDNFFDVFVASEVLEHMDDEELEVCIKEIKRVLKKGGFGILTFPAEENLKKSECFCPNCKTKFHKWGHKQYFNRKIIRMKFSEFKIVSVREYFGRYIGKTLFDSFFGLFAWSVQTFINYFIAFPNKFVTNRSYVVIIKNR